METKALPSVPFHVPHSKWLDLADWLEENAGVDEATAVLQAAPPQKKPSSSPSVGSYGFIASGYGYVASGAIGSGHISHGTIASGMIIVR